MDIDFAILADAARFRDGLVYIIGGGIEQMAIPQLPAPVKAAIAVQFTGTRAEIARQQRLEVRFVDDDGTDIPGFQALDVTFTPPEPSTPNGRIQFGGDFQGTVHRALTVYIEILLNGRAYKRLALQVIDAPLSKAA